MDKSSVSRMWTDNYPDLGRGAIATKPLYDPDVYAVEVEKVFKKSWLYAGDLTEVENPGDFFVRDLPFAKASIIVLRGQDGQLRAFHNICTHRGNKLEWGKRGSCKGFACNYHGWTFDTCGELVHVPDEDRYYEFDKNCRGLIPVSVSTWADLVFIHLDVNPQQTLDEFLGEWGQSMTGYPWLRFPSFTRAFTADIKANWKVVMYAFIESLHFAHLHKRTAGPSFVTPEHPFGKMHAAEIVGRHARLSSPGRNAYFEPSPVQMATLRHTAQHNGEVGDGVRIPFKDAGPGVNPAKTDDWVGDMNMVFPNLQVQVFEDFYLLYIYWPVSHDRTIFESRFHYRTPRSATDLFALEMQVCDLRDIFLEDFSTNEMTYEALQSGALKDLVLHDYEIVIRHWHKTLAEAIKARSFRGDP